MKRFSWARTTLLPLLAALIWGTAFVAQSQSADYIEPFTFNAIRSAIAVVILVPVAAVYGRIRRRADAAAGVPEPTAEEKKSRRALLVRGGIVCGFFLSTASYLQQAGLGDTEAGKAGFITALYVVLVPVFGVFLKKKAPAQVWAGAVLAVAGLYFLCITGSFSIRYSDFLVFLCAIIFALQILAVDHYVPHLNPVALSCVQFATHTVISALGMLLFESPSWAAVAACVPQLLYVGIFSSGVAYTLQIIAQSGDASPAVVSLLLSLESVFSVLAGAVVLGEQLSGREYFGCVLMFAAVILAEIPLGSLRRKH